MVQLSKACPAYNSLEHKTNIESQSSTYIYWLEQIIRRAGGDYFRPREPIILEHQLCVLGISVCSFVSVII
jgi:hypothetical protein